MNRRKFIKNAGLITAGTLAAPYILPTGRLFAATGARKVNHVVFILFAGGIRNQESVKKQYLANQGLATEGNVMPNILRGAQPGANLVYQPWNTVLNNPLQESGTLFPEMRYKQGPTGHYNGHTVAMTGNYTETGLNLNINPEYPTVFEYYRKHSDPARSALNAWWLSEGLGPYPSLNYSRHPDYGAIYGANYMRPATTIGNLGQEYLSTASDYQPDDVSRINMLRNFLDSNFENQAGPVSGIANNDEDRERIRSFVKGLLSGSNPIEWPTPTGGTQGLTGDLINIGAAWKVMEAFQPELMVINTFNLDVCHSNFSQYINFLHRADHGVGWLWNKIQGPEGAALGLKDDTVMILMPEHGRNADPNNVNDNNGLRAYDHTSDANSRQIFSLIAGPPGVINQNQSVGTGNVPVGESIDIIPTIAELLGFRDQVPSGLLPGRVLHEALA